ncbi:YciI family protein [Prosthecobacter fluviatilis]|uniref:YciI family protein n=1 Tax=Prosthecobacter fluviatilis TaxID=445931 RepID=A0ABW0KQE7_9BACT
MKTEPTHQYMFLVRGCSCSAGHSAEEMQAHMKTVYDWIDDLTQKGIFSAAQPLTPEGKIVSGPGLVSDGIAAESKESVGGFFILNVASMDEAVRIAESSPMFGNGGSLEVRRIAALTCD